MIPFLKPRDPADVLREQYYEAQRECIAHTAAAEHHKALADMYRARIDRVAAILGMDRSEQKIDPTKRGSR